MKKRLFSLILMITFLISIGVTGCKKNDSVNSDNAEVSNTTSESDNIDTNNENNSDEMKPLTEGSWKQQEFYLSTWVVLSTDGDAKSAIKLCKEAGLNLVETESANLSICDEIGINAIANDWMSSGSKVKNIYEDIKNIYEHKSLIGYYSWDEVPGNKNKVAKAKNALFKKYDPTRLAYSIIFPSYGAVHWNVDKALDEKSYDEYVKDYMDVVKPEVLSFDSYPVYAYDWSKSDASKAMVCDWYRDLGLMRKTALDYKVPFWYYFQSVNVSNTDYDENTLIASSSTTDSQISLQMFTGLAYNAKYLSYYLAPGYIYTMDGKSKTNRFDAAKANNTAVMNAGKYLYNKTSENIYHTGLSESYLKTYYLDSLSSSDIIAAAPDGLIISQFKDNTNTKYLLIVNKDYVNAKTGELTLKNVKDVSRFDVKTGEVLNVGNTNIIKLNIPMGYAELYIIK